ncbi:MAG: hypothetical protein H6825_04185 [Planctomycetes bacterium]|nr:hypothetical protein [Planctomycetota bacterium]
MKTLTRAAIGAVLLASLTPAALARDDDGKSVETAILDVLLERGIIDEATYEELVGMAERERAEKEQVAALESRLERLAHPDVSTSGGKPGKLQFSSDDGKWSLGFKGRLQVRVEAQQGESGNRKADEVNFSVPRGRLAFFGKAGSDKVDYKLEIDTPTQSKVNSSTKALSVKDAYVGVQLQKDDHSKTGLKVGQFKFPFGREIQASSSKLAIVDDSIASKEFAPDREPGAMVASDLMDGKLQLFLGLSNGEGGNGANQDGQDGTSSTGLRRGVRVVFNPLGYVNEDLSAFQGQGKNGAWDTKIAFGGSYMVNADQPADVDGDGTAGDGRSNDRSVGYEMQVVSGPLAFLYEMYDRTAELNHGGGQIDDDGHTIQLAYQVVPNEIELVAAVSEVDFDAKDDLRETTLGVNYFMDKHNSKLSLDITRRENQTTDGKDATRVRLQSQTIF